MTESPYVICIAGPTAAGKTQLAMDLAERMPCRIISVDSALIYRGMDIGTAKPGKAELERYPHALVDILEPAQSYSAADFRQDALALIDEAINAGQIPLLVGGTMLYFRALLGGLSNLPAADPAVRAELEKQAAEHGWEALHQQLADVDPVAAARIHPNDPQRTLRALEVYTISGQTLTELTNVQKNVQQSGLRYPSYQFAVAPEQRAVLHQRIEQRFMQMLDDGFEEEVRRLRERGDLHLDLPSMRCVGYRQMWQYLDGVDDYPTMVNKGIAATRQLAKRQLTWLRGWPDLHWLDPTQMNLLDSAWSVLQTKQPTRPQRWLKNT